MRSALNQYLNPQIPARIVSVGQKLVKITVRGRDIEAAEATVLEVKRTYALVDDGFDRCGGAGSTVHGGGSRRGF